MVGRSAVWLNYNENFVVQRDFVYVFWRMQYFFLRKNRDGGRRVENRLRIIGDGDGIANDIASPTRLLLLASGPAPADPADSTVHAPRG